MSMHPKAHLAYGYSLGSDGSWKVREAGEYGGLELPWLDSENVEPSIQRKLLEVQGLSESEIEKIGEYQWGERLKELRGIQVISFGHSGYDEYNYVLAVNKFKAYAYTPEEVTIPVVEDDAELQLQWAIEELGITPLQRSPAWLLFPSYG